MRNALKNLAHRSMLVQRTYRRYIQPRLPQYEPETYILRGMRFDEVVDIGAHAGTYSILLSPNSRTVHAFEPSSHSFAILKALRLPNVLAHNMALGDALGEAEIALPSVGGKTDYALATLRPLGSGEFVNVVTEKVRVARFDDFANQIEFARIDFVKIDVEGFEMRVLAGMSRLLESHKPALLVEIEQRHNSRYRDVFDRLAALGYGPYVTEDGVSLARFELDDLPRVQSAERLAADDAQKFKIGERKSYLNNFFFLQPEQFGRFQIRG